MFNKYTLKKTLGVPGRLGVSNGVSSSLLIANIDSFQSGDAKTVAKANNKEAVVVAQAVELWRHVPAIRVRLPWAFFFPSVAHP